MNYSAYITYLHHLEYTYITYNTNIAYNVSDIINNTCTTTTTHNTNLKPRPNDRNMST